MYVVKAGRDTAAAAEAKLVQTNPAEQYYLRAASSYARLQDLPRAAELLKISQTRFPQSEKPRVALAEFEPQPT